MSNGFIFFFNSRLIFHGIFPESRLQWGTRDREGVWSVRDQFTTNIFIAVKLIVLASAVGSTSLIPPKHHSLSSLPPLLCRKKVKRRREAR